jgi:hypothetical protein
LLAQTDHRTRNPAGPSVSPTETSGDPERRPSSALLEDPVDLGIVDATYAELGRHMNIKDRPATYEAFASLLDAYEREHFAYSPGGRAVSDATLALLLRFHPRPLRPLLRRATMALLDQPLREAFAYPRPDRVTAALTHAGLRARALVERRLPPRLEPRYVRQMPEFAIYADGYRVEELGTFPSP